jgi:uncharacterized cysteine cluster protein YcgN (CxxCxxCC family)
MDRFWESKRLEELSPDEWEAVCDGCGLCCLHKFQDTDSDEVAYTDVACRLLDCDSCRCQNYASRTELVADCVSLKPGDREQLKWMPSTCAYRLLDQGQPLPEWHYLVSGDRQSVHVAGISIRGRAVSETFVHEEEIETRIVSWVSTDS